MFQLLRGKFEGFLKQLEVGEERLQSCNDLAARLIRNKHPQSSAVRETLQELRYIYTGVHTPESVTSHLVSSIIPTFIFLFLFPHSPHCFWLLSHTLFIVLLSSLCKFSLLFFFFLQCMLGGFDGRGHWASGAAAESRGMSPLLPRPGWLADSYPGTVSVNTSHPHAHTVHVCWSLSLSL